MDAKETIPWYITAKASKTKNWFAQKAGVNIPSWYECSVRDSTSTFYKHLEIVSCSQSWVAIASEQVIFEKSYISFRSEWMNLVLVGFSLCRLVQFSLVFAFLMCDDVFYLSS